MGRTSLIQEIGEWLIDQALAEPGIIEMFSEVCNRLYAVGVPVTRARLTWPTLHPLFQAETILWCRNQDTEFEQFVHQDEASDAWLRSPMAFMIENQLSVLRRNLDGPNKLVDFDILKELINQGYTDYLVIATNFLGPAPNREGRNSGIIVNWSTDREGGFSNDDVEALNKIQRRFAAAVRSVVQRRIATNITETYLGKYAGSQVLDGAIKLGDGRQTEAVVWYADMRCSTSLADTMAAEDFLELLNDYYRSSAEPAIQFGGEVLDFIGDAVLAIFPYEDEEGKSQAISCATMAMEKSLETARKINTERRDAGKIEFDFGLGLNSGTLMFGNIGVSTRLAFSVIGPTVNEAERIESLTKMVEAKALATSEIASHWPERWVSVGDHQLDGVSSKRELFALRSEPLGQAMPVKIRKAVGIDLPN